MRFDDTLTPAQRRAEIARLEALRNSAAPVVEGLFSTGVISAGATAPPEITTSSKKTTKPSGGISYPSLGENSLRVFRAPEGSLKRAGVQVPQDFAARSTTALVQPPPGNTGVVRTFHSDQPIELLSGVHLCLDWLSVTFGSYDAGKASVPVFPDAVELTSIEVHGLLETVKNLFGDGREWQPMPVSRQGYRSGVQRGNIQILFDGQLGMGLHVDVSGQGCRQLESEGIVEPDPESPFNWLQFLKTIKLFGGKFSRLDGAVDDFDGALNIERILALCKEKACVSRLTKGNYREDFLLSEGTDCGGTINFGSPQSSKKVRIYNKYAERLESDPDFVPPCASGIWNRAEVQARAECAENFAHQLIERGLCVIADVLNHTLSFREPNPGDTNRRRWPVAGWWADFIALAERASLWSRPEPRTIEECAEYIERQYAPLLAAVVSAPDFGVDWLRRLLLDGERRLKPRHLSMLSVHTTAIAGALRPHSHSAAYQRPGLLVGSLMARAADVLAAMKNPLLKQSDHALYYPDGWGYSAV
jgi:phage replication initiation protein